MAMQVDDAAASSQQWRLEEEVELRVEVDFDASLTVILLSGTCEILGVELATKREYIFSGDAFAIFTWFGCTVETRGARGQVYMTQQGDSTAKAALNTHSHLEMRRESAAQALSLSVVGAIYTSAEDVAQKRGDAVGAPSPLLESASVSSHSLTPFLPKDETLTRGPRVLIVGSSDSGKSTLAATLAAYAARCDRAPILVQLDPSLGDGSAVPGAITAQVLHKANNLNVEARFSAPSVEALSFWFGHTGPGENGDHALLYKDLIAKLAAAVNERLEHDPKAQSSGIIVDTAHWKVGEPEGLDLIKFVAQVFAIDVILVIGADKLYNEISQQLPKTVSVVRIPRSGGLVTRDDRRRRRTRHRRVHEYFYGQSHARSSQLAALTPSTLELRISSLNIVKVVEASKSVASSMLPVGQGSMLEPLQVVVLAVSTELVHNVLAVCHEGPSTFTAIPDDAAASSNNPDNPHQHLLECSIAGYVVITNVNLETGTITLLSPCGGDLPSKNLILGRMEWMESTAL